MHLFALFDTILNNFVAFIIFLYNTIPLLPIHCEASSNLDYKLPISYDYIHIIFKYKPCVSIKSQRYFMFYFVLYQPIRCKFILYYYSKFLNSYITKRLAWWHVLHCTPMHRINGHGSEILHKSQTQYFIILSKDFDVQNAKIWYKQ